MENSASVGFQPWSGKTAQGLEGVHGRLRLAIGEREIGTLLVEGVYVALIPDTSGPADATAVCATEDVVRQLLRGDMNPFIASMRRLALLKGDRGFGTRVILGLQVGSPFAELSDAGDKHPQADAGGKRARGE